MNRIDATMDGTFPRSYECQLSTVPVPTLMHYYYPGASTLSGRDGLLVEVGPENGQSWLGTFAFGEVSTKGISGVFTTPDPERLCVVARGNGYIVSASTPTTWETVKATPVIDVRSIRSQGVIIFANFTELVAYGATGIKWRTRRLAWDNLKITDVTDAVVKGEYWDIRTESISSFVVDLATGANRGGIEEN